MANNGGTITRKDIIEDQALRFGEPLVQQANNVISANNKLIESFKQLNTIANAYRGADNMGKVINNRQLESNAITQLVASMKQEQQAVIDLQQQITKLTETKSKSIQKTTEEIVNNRLLATNATRAAQANSTFANSYQRLTAQMAISATRVQDLVARGKLATQTQKEYDKELRVAQNEFNKLNSKVLQADKAVNRFNRNVGNYPGQAITGLRDLIGAFGVVGGVTAFAAITKDIFSTSKEINSLDLALKNVTKTQQDFADTQEFLTRVSEDYGIEINGLTKSYTGFLAASQNAIDANKITAQQIQNIFESVSKAAGAMGLSVEQQQGAFLALQQMISKGNVQAEEIRGQLAERLPGAFGILAKSMGVTETELNKLLKDGKVLATDVLPAFARELEKAYGVENLDRVESLAASTTRLSNAWTNFIREITDGNSVITKFFVSVINFADKAIKGLGLLSKLASERRDEQLQSILESGYKEELKLLRDMQKEEEKLGTAEKDRLSVYSANEIISSGKERLEQLRAERTEIREVITALEDEQKTTENLTSLRVIRDRLNKNNKEYNKSLETTNLILGQVKAAQEFLNKSEEKGFKSASDNKVKRQKQDIDYLKDVYDLRKQNIENELNGLKRITDNEEKNFEVRLEAANNYYFQKEALIKLDYEEQLRLNDLNYKNQKEQYNLAIQQGRATNSNLQELYYQYLVRKEKADADYEGKKNELAIESALKLKGVLDSINDQREVNVISSKQLDSIRELNKELNNVSAATSYERFKELEERKVKIATESNEEIIRVELRRVQAQIEALKADEQNSQYAQDLREKEIKLQTDLANVEQERLEKTKELVLDLKRATDDYLNTFTSGFLQNAGLQSAEIFFKIEENGKTAFENLLNGADSVEEKLRVIFNAIGEVAKESFGVVVNAFNEFSQAKIQSIDDELSALEESYSKQAELAKNDKSQKEALDKEYEIKREKLEQKKREEQRKQAIYNKALKIVDISISTAQAIMQAYAQTGPILGSIFAALIGALGEVQLATVVATPIPKYKTGRKGGKAELAYVGDGGVSEVIESKSGKAVLTPNKATLTMLEEGDIVHKTKEDYIASQRYKMANSMKSEYNKVTKLQNMIDKSKHGNSDIEESVKRAIKEGFKNAKVINQNNMPKIDLDHAIWAFNNRKW